MDKIPPEILHGIYSIARTDDGTTGRSLSLASRYIHETSKEDRLQSVSVDGTKQTSKLLERLEDLPEAERRIICLVVCNNAWMRDPECGSMVELPPMATFLRNLLFLFMGSTWVLAEYIANCIPVVSQWMLWFHRMVIDALAPTRRKAQKTETWRHTSR